MFILQLDYLPYFLHSAEDVIHVADSSYFELILKSIEVQTCSAYEDLSSLFDEGVQVLNDLWLNACYQLDALVHEENI